MFFSIILTPVFFALILVMHILYFVVWILRTILLPVLAIYYFIIGVQMCIGAFSYGFGAVFSIGVFLAGLAYIALSIFIGLIVIMLFKINLSGVKVPILTYPECDLCSCSPDSSTNEDIGEGVNAPSSTNDTNKAVPCPAIVSNTNITSITLTPGILQLFGPQTFRVPTRNPTTPTGYPAARASVYNQNLTGLLYDFQYASNNIGAPYMSFTTIDDDGANDRWIYTTSLPMSDMLNLFNVKAKYFNGTSTTPNPNNSNPGGGVNIIEVNFQPNQPTIKHYDNTIVMIILLL
jgi:hypothetical protein